MADFCQAITNVADFFYHVLVTLIKRIAKTTIVKATAKTKSNNVTGQQKVIKATMGSNIFTISCDGPYYNHVFWCDTPDLICHLHL